MNDKIGQDKKFDRDDETMARLLRLAGPRAPIPGDIEARVYDRVKTEWRASTQQPEGAAVYAEVHRHWKKQNKPRTGFRRWAMPLALAATIVAAIAVVLQPPPPVPGNIPVGTVARIAGDDASGYLPPVGHLVHPGDRLTTGAGQGMSLLLSNAESLRIDEETTLVVRAKDDFQLVEGRIYADTGDFMYRDHGLVIGTSLGSVTDVGTQFAVKAGDDFIDVAVREGRVDVAQDSEQFVAVAGERLTIHRDDGVTVEALAMHDPYWDWATSLVPAFDIENKSLLDFLRWAARETGRELVFETNELRMSAMRTDLHGSVSDFDPLEAVESVLATTSFKFHIEADRIVIEK
ncbi:MAG: FecR family protein [Planctomycetes bacterium]|nr:FecR family protein [Planctomycetota bacterium]